MYTSAHLFMIYIELVINRKYIKIADKVDQSHKKELKIWLSPYLRGHGRYKSSMYPCVPSQIQSLVLCLIREPRKYSLRACQKMPNHSKVGSIFFCNIIFSCKVLRFRAIISKYTYKKDTHIYVWDILRNIHFMIHVKIAP